MHHLRFGTTSILLLGLCLSASLTTRSVAFQIGGGPGSSAGKVQVQPKLSVDKVPAGTTFRAAAVLSIADGWHINSHTPTYDYLIATSLELQQREGIIVTDLRYPKGTNLKFGFAEDSLSVYAGNPVIFFTMKVSEKAAIGNDTLRAVLEIQACNNQVCLAPASIIIPIPLEIVGPGEKANPINKDLFSSYESSGSATTPGNKSDIGQIFEERGTFVAFLAIFLIGLALESYTLCVPDALCDRLALWRPVRDKHT